MIVRFTTSIASDQWSYAPDQEVTLGREWTETEIPADVGRLWLSSGIVEQVKPDKPAPQPPAKKGAK